MYQRILVPFDGSATSLRGLDEALMLAKSTGAAVRLIHMLDDFLYVGGVENCTAYTRDVIPDLRRAAYAILQSGREHAARAGIEVETQLLERVGARLSDVVEEQVQSWPADLVVMGSHGRRGMRRAILGSDAEQVLRHAHVPVLVVRAPDKAGAVRAELASAAAA